MRPESRASAADVVRASRVADIVGGLWGFAEATLFFIVPDVWLSLVSAQSVRTGLRVCAWTLAGALVGGTAVYTAASVSPETTRRAILHVPAISPAMVAAVQTQLDARGLSAVLVGPAQGRPYKIYASEWGVSRRSLAGFLAVSVPARLVRFLLSIVAAAAIARLIAPWTCRRVGRERVVLLMVWAVFYAMYFRAVGW